MSAAKITMTENDIEKIFNEIDDDGNGYITHREAKKAFKKISGRFGLQDKVIIIEVFAENMIQEYYKNNNLQNFTD